MCPVTSAISAEKDSLDYLKHTISDCWIMHNMVWIWPVLLGVTCDILDCLNLGKELLNAGGEGKTDVLAKYFSCTSSSTMFLLMMKGGVFRGHSSKFSPHEAGYVYRNEVWLLYWRKNKWTEWYVSLFLSLDCGCVHRPPPALPIPLLIIVMSEERS